MRWLISKCSEVVANVERSQPLPTCDDSIRVSQRLKSVTEDMLNRVWQELDYRLV